MSKTSEKKNKNYYFTCRDEAGLTRVAACERTSTISEDRLEKGENDKVPFQPRDILELAEAYNRPEMCNYYCKNDCAIGKNYQLALTVADLPDIILETVACLNDIDPLVNKLIDISRDGEISDDEIPDFAKIQYNLEKTALAVNALELWVKKTSTENKMNAQLLQAELQRLSK